MHTCTLQSRTDEELVRQALCGDIRAYNVLVKRFRGAVVLVAEQTLNSREVAEDVAQEVFLVAYESLTQLRSPDRFASWLYAITRYRARRVRKQELRTIPLEPESMYADATCLPLQEETHPEKALFKAEFQNELARALATLKPEHRLAFLLRYEEAWPVMRISEFLALPVSTIKWRLHQARKQLKQQLQPLPKESEDE
ncbi:MAG: polymerase sigma factor SigW-like protein [Chthonomonadaceae bacterium]|nr:polymerase sigma factor SigW-like protein [Chthonomonadaceae bacterium]